MYQGFDVGLVEPTWEPKAQMLEQLPDSVRGAVICWYGYTDGRIEARVNPTELGHYSYIFTQQSETWVLVDSHQAIAVD